MAKRKQKIKLEYDDQPNDVIDKINEILEKYNLQFFEGKGGDDWVEYILEQTTEEHD